LSSGARSFRAPTVLLASAETELLESPLGGKKGRRLSAVDGDSDNNFLVSTGGGKVTVSSGRMVSTVPRLIPVFSFCWGGLGGEIC
jgi:hypothetical protein